MTIQSAIEELSDHGVPEVIALLRHLEAEMGQLAVRRRVDFPIDTDHCLVLAPPLPKPLHACRFDVGVCHGQTVTEDPGGP